MKKSLLLTLILLSISIPAARAEGWADDDANDGAAQGADQGNFTFKTGSDEARDAGRGYILENPARSRFGGWNENGTSGKTGNQKLNLPPVVTAMPIIKDGVNTGLTGGSIALKTQFGKEGLLPIPMTGTDSFAHQATKLGVGELIYGGNEGTPGPSSGFTPNRFINNGIASPDLGTGHKSDAPSAWGTPLKYNQFGGVIQGEQ